MPTLTIMPSGKTVSVAEGLSVLEAIASSGETLGSKCGGKAECGSCHIFVLEGRKGLSRMAAEENGKLDTIVGVGSKSRLACQAKIGTDDVTVEILSFV